MSGRRDDLVACARHRSGDPLLMLGRRRLVAGARDHECGRLDTPEQRPQVIGDSVAWNFADNGEPGSLDAGALTPDVVGGTVGPPMPPGVSTCNMAPAEELLQTGNFTLHIG